MNPWWTSVVVEKMTQNHQFAILVPLVVGAGAVVCTIFVHALAIVATVNFFRHERKRGRAGAGALIDLAILTLAISFAFVAHLIEIALWAVLLVLCGEFREFELRRIRHKVTGTGSKGESRRTYRRGMAR